MHAFEQHIFNIRMLNIFIVTLKQRCVSTGILNVYHLSITSCFMRLSVKSESLIVLITFWRFLSITIEKIRNSHLKQPPEGIFLKSYSGKFHIIHMKTSAMQCFFIIPLVICIFLNDKPFHYLHFAKYFGMDILKNSCERLPLKKDLTDWNFHQLLCCRKFHTQGMETFLHNLPDGFWNIFSIHIKAIWA